MATLCTFEYCIYPFSREKLFQLKYQTKFFVKLNTFLFGKVIRLHDFLHENINENHLLSLKWL